MREERHSVEAAQAVIQTLGPAKIANSMFTHQEPGGGDGRFMDESVRVRVDPFLHGEAKGQDKVPSFEVAGPWDKVYFDPAKLKAAIVTCGGMCPGITPLCGPSCCSCTTCTTCAMWWACATAYRASSPPTAMT